MNYHDNFLNALRLKYKAEIEVAKSNIDVYLHNPVGIGEHPDLVSAIDSQIEMLASAQDKLTAINQYLDIDTYLDGAEPSSARRKNFDELRPPRFDIDRYPYE